MGFVRKTPAGTYRACWRDPAGKQRSKSFATKREASRFLAEIESAKNRGLYIDPHAGRIKLREYTATWTSGRNVERTTLAASASIIRTHVVPRWGAVPLGKIDHSAVQQWITELSGKRSPATVRKCYHTLTAIMRLAVRDRLIAFNPCDGFNCLPCVAQTKTSGPSAGRPSCSSCCPPSRRGTTRSWHWPAAPAFAGVNASVCAGTQSTWATPKSTSSASPSK